MGTREGTLLMYGVKLRSGAEPEVQLLRSNKYFSKKPIQQLAVVPEENILIALKEGAVSVHAYILFLTLELNSSSIINQFLHLDVTNIN